MFQEFYRIWTKNINVDKIQTAKNIVELEINSNTIMVENRLEPP